MPAHARDRHKQGERHYQSTPSRHALVAKCRDRGKAAWNICNRLGDCQQETEFALNRRAGTNHKTVTHQIGRHRHVNHPWARTGGFR